MELLYEELPKTLLESHFIMLSEAISTIEFLVQLAQSKHSNLLKNILLLLINYNLRKILSSFNLYCIIYTWCVEL